MIRGDARLVRRLRSLVRRERRRLPASRRDKRPGSRHYPWRTLRWVIPVAAFFLPLSELKAEHLFALLALHTTLSLLRRVGELANVLGNAQELWVPCFLPIKDSRIFDAQTRLWRGSLRVLVTDWIAFAAGLACFRDEAAWAWLALPLAGAQAMVAAGVAIWAARRGPHPAWLIASGALHAGAFFGLLFANKIPPLGRWLAGDGAQLVLHGTPAGLLVLLADAAANGALTAGLAGLALAGAALGIGLAARRAWRSWRAEFDPWPVVEKALCGEAWPAAAAEASEAPESSDPAPRAATPRERDELRVALASAWRSDPGARYAERGPVELVISFGFSPRQRRQLELYGPPASMIHRSVLRAGLVALVAGVLGGVLGSRAVGVGGAIWAFIWMLPFWSGRWAVLFNLPQGLALVPAHVFTPVSLWSVAAAYLNVGLARVFLGMGLFMIALLPWMDVGLALRHTAQAGVVAATLLPLVFVAIIAECTNDTSARWWLTLLAIFLGLFYLAFGTGLMVTMFMAQHSGVIALCAAGLLVLGFGFLALYLWAAGRGWFDFVKQVGG